MTPRLLLFLTFALRLLQALSDAPAEPEIFAAVVDDGAQYRSKIQALDSTLAQSKDDLAKFKEAYNVLLAEKEKLVASKEGEVSAIKTLADTVQDELKKVKAAFAQKEQEIKTLKNANAALGETVTALQGSYLALETQLTQAKSSSKKVEEAEGKLTKVQGELTKAQGELTKIQGEVEKSQSLNKELQGALDTKTSEVDALKLKVKELKDGQEAASSQKEEIAKLTKEIEDLTTKLHVSESKAGHILTTKYHSDILFKDFVKFSSRALTASEIKVREWLQVFLTATKAYISDIQEKSAPHIQKAQEVLNENWIKVKDTAAPLYAEHIEPHYVKHVEPVLHPIIQDAKAKATPFYEEHIQPHAQKGLQVALEFYGEANAACREFYAKTRGDLVELFRTNEFLKPYTGEDAESLVSAISFFLLAILLFITRSYIFSAVLYLFLLPFRILFFPLRIFKRSKRE